MVPRADALFGEPAGRVPWRAERRRTYDGVVAVPRLLAHYREGEPLPGLALTEARDLLGAHCATEPGEGFATAGLWLYRDGRDGIARHGDRTVRSASRDTPVALLSLADPRDPVLRPRGDVRPRARISWPAGTGHGRLGCRRPAVRGP
ncbi:hypothetical protein [Streptomyces roseolus]|uniref:hypothetical protein n=1 Tax=Streptomyces roseolus TaxID=67358 RepID=UPI001674ECB8|nr:hypothetical protein [Streptomyces roseolus]GGR57462.1 hypothetical protein GCM10010282_58080 [Streptomyces roseolus]